MKQILGVILILLGIFLGVYLGIWVFFVGGIIQLVQQVQLIADHHAVQAAAIAWGVVKIVLSGTVGGLVTWILCAFGMACLFGYDTPKQYRRRR